MSNGEPELRSSWEYQLTPLRKIDRRKVDHRYVLINCKLVDVGDITDNLCPRCGMQNCGRNH